MKPRQAEFKSWGFSNKGCFTEPAFKLDFLSPNEKAHGVYKPFCIYLYETDTEMIQQGTPLMIIRAQYDLTPEYPSEDFFYQHKVTSDCTLNFTKDAGIARTFTNAKLKALDLSQRLLHRANKSLYPEKSRDLNGGRPFKNLRIFNVQNLLDAGESMDLGLFTL